MKLPSFILYSLFTAVVILTSQAQASKQSSTTNNRELIENANNILFLGDSITYAGFYVENFETWLTLSYPKRQFSVINVGLSSETVSGISEKGHANGRFPRPYLHERLDRVLAKTKPDLIFACYGMNCGIYKPFDEERFQKYKDGIHKLKSKAETSGAKIIFITPPYFDSIVNKKQAYYTDVLARYSQWLVSQRKEGWNVIDLNTHMTSTIAQKRMSNPKFTFQKDAVHPNSAGHWVITQPILSWFGDQASANCHSAQEMIKQLGANTKIHKLVSKRSQILRNAWLTATEHKRPDVPKGLPLSEANQQASTITDAINNLKASK